MVPSLSLKSTNYFVSRMEFDVFWLPLIIQAQLVRQRDLFRLSRWLCAKQNQRDFQLALTQFLLWYRTTPHPVAEKTPTELIFGRQIRTRLDLSLRKKFVSKLGKDMRKDTRESQESWKWKILYGMQNYCGTEKWIPCRSYCLKFQIP